MMPSQCWSGHARMHSSSMQRAASNWFWMMVRRSMGEGRRASEKRIFSQRRGGRGEEGKKGSRVHRGQKCLVVVSEGFGELKFDGLWVFGGCKWGAVDEA